MARKRHIMYLCHHFIVSLFRSSFRFSFLHCSCYSILRIYIYYNDYIYTASSSLSVRMVASHDPHFACPQWFRPPPRTPISDSNVRTVTLPAGLQAEFVLPWTECSKIFIEQCFPVSTYGKGKSSSQQPCETQCKVPGKDFPEQPLVTFWPVLTKCWDLCLLASCRKRNLTVLSQGTKHTNNL